MKEHLLEKLNELKAVQEKRNARDQQQSEWLRAFRERPEIALGVALGILTIGSEDTVIIPAYNPEEWWTIGTGSFEDGEQPALAYSRGAWRPISEWWEAFEKRLDMVLG